MAHVSRLMNIYRKVSIFRTCLTVISQNTLRYTYVEIQTPNIILFNLEFKLLIFIFILSLRIVSEKEDKADKFNHLSNSQKAIYLTAEIMVCAF